MRFSSLVLPHLVDPFGSSCCDIRGFGAARTRIQRHPWSRTTSQFYHPFASNLFGITPVDEAPVSRFLSLSLSRPGSSDPPSLLGIGRHPPDLVPDPSKINYSTVVSAHQGTLFWGLQVRAITVYINGTAMPVQIGQLKSGNVFPVAVLDSGVPFILAATDIANGIYGALGIGPGADGQCEIFLLLLSH